MLLALAVYHPEGSGKTKLTERTLLSVYKTVNLQRHRMVVLDNGSCDETRRMLESWHRDPYELIRLEKNIGTAAGINKIWRLRKEEEYCLKLDDDVEIWETGWADLMEFVFERDPWIGICGLKRKDLDEWPDNPNEWYRSKLRPLRHVKGERWIVLEEVKHVFGTCQAYNWRLLNKIGYLYQMQDEGNVYGFDDGLASIRAQLARFKTVFLPHIPIDHIDPGNSEWSEQKREHAGIWLARYHQVAQEYRDGTRPLYWEDSNAG